MLLTAELLKTERILGKKPRFFEQFSLSLAIELSKSLK
jgi:hypothetical protein